MLPLPKSTTIHLTVAGEFECTGDGCRYCADEDRWMLRVFAFTLDALGVTDSDGALAEELLDAWKDKRR